MLSKSLICVKRKASAMYDHTTITKKDLAPIFHIQKQKLQLLLIVNVILQPWESCTPKLSMFYKCFLSECFLEEISCGQKCLIVSSLYCTSISQTYDAQKLLFLFSTQFIILKQWSTSLWWALRQCRGFVSWHQSLACWRSTQSQLPPYGWP